jgi:single-strand DNA-binding protein
MLNQVQLIGFLGADPEIRVLNDGARVANLRIATTESWRDRESGERREKTEWHRVTVWGHSAKFLEDYARKGTLVFVEGKLTTRKWQDQAGEDRYSTEISVQQRGGEVKILRGGADREEEQPEQPQQQARSSRGRGKKHQTEENFSADLDDEIPF